MTRNQKGEYHIGTSPQVLILLDVRSALSLRVFGEDLTVFGKQMLERQSASQSRREAAAAAKGAQDMGGSEPGIDFEVIDQHKEDFT